MSWPDWVRIIICGDRHWPSIEPIQELIFDLREQHGSRLIIIEGEAPGADQMSRVAAEQLSVHVARVHALWETRRRSAGPQRNLAMFALQPHEVYGFHKNIRESKGTKNMLNQAVGSADVFLYDGVEFKEIKEKIK